MQTCQTSKFLKICSDEVLELKSQYNLNVAFHTGVLKDCSKINWLSNLCKTATVAGVTHVLQPLLISSSYSELNKKRITVHTLRKRN